ncbi:MAG TPA: cupin domain-containing protein [Sphingomicrobium sp.]
MTIIRNGMGTSQKGPPDWFTGDVTIEPLSNPPEPSRVGVASVTFERGSRTAWHMHPLGQTLIVTAGIGWHQCQGEPREEIRTGDVVWCPPNHKHWHGATDTSAMTHIAVQESLNGSPVKWMEHVSDEEYLGLTGVK